MTCPECSQATILSNALNLCSLQLRQDCGRGCIGLLDGYSTIQVNATGDLEICSKIGTECQCHTVITPDPGVDSFTADGGGQFTHVSVVGTSVTIDFCTLLDEVTTEWDDLTLAPGWVPAPGLQPPQYRLICDSIVQMRGCIFHDDADGDNAVPELIATLPTVIRPPLTIHIPGDTCETIEIEAGGDIITRPSSVSFTRCFEGTQYYLD